VFDGSSKNPYRENDKPNPQGVYGQTKLKGEIAIQSSGCRHIILRTAWIFSEYGNNFLRTMLQLGQKHDELNVVSDQIGCPTYAQDIALAIVEIIKSLHTQKNNGIYHFCGDFPCSWYDFSNAIFKQAKTKNLKVPGRINSITTSAYPTPARRPPFSVLNCSKIENEFGIFPSNWVLGIKKAISKIK
jgi:dTDP-4-dehydrorhamnose reductase